MTKLIEKPFDPFAVLFSDFFKPEPGFNSFLNSKLNYPVDIYKKDNNLFLEVACVGVDKEDIDLKIEKDILKIKYEKQEEEDKEIIYSSIAKRSFNFGYKISSEYDLSQLEAKLDKGLLKIKIPKTKDAEEKTIIIK